MPQVELTAGLFLCWVSSVLLQSKFAVVPFSLMAPNIRHSPLYVGKKFIKLVRSQSLLFFFSCQNLINCEHINTQTL